MTQEFTSEDKDIPAVSGKNNVGIGVRGVSTSGTAMLGTSETGVALWGGSTSSSGVGGMSKTGYGVHGVSDSHNGVEGDSQSGNGVTGHTSASADSGSAGVTGAGPNGALGVYGTSSTRTGVGGRSEQGIGIHGIGDIGGGVRGDSRDGVGVAANSENAEAFFGTSNASTKSTIAAFNNNANGTAAALYAEKKGTSGYAGVFNGRVRVEGTLEVTVDVIIPGADCAEPFPVAAGSRLEPGTVAVLDDNGRVCESSRPYDARVAGVVSGAGDYRPGLVLDHRSHRDDVAQPIALLGKVFCKVDATKTPVAVGDLLTTSETPGHAMRASDPQQAFGAVIGKALRPLDSGMGLIPMIVALQ